MTQHWLPRFEDADLEISLGFRQGWCDLGLDDGTNGVSITATTLRDAFSDLVRAVDALLCGSVCQSVLWGGEGRAWFLDLTVDPKNSLGVAVHAAHDPRWFLSREVFCPVRGPVQFEANVPFPAFARTFADTVRMVEISDVDATGLITQWGWKFPGREFGALENRAVSHGYKPRTLDEYEHIRAVRGGNRGAGRADQ